MSDFVPKKRTCLMKSEDKIQKGSDLFIVDNSDSDWKVKNYLHEWTEIRGIVEKHIKNSYFKKVQAPVGVKATLKAWMELS